MPPLIVFVEPALHQVADHGKEFIKRFTLCGHFWLVTNGNEHVVVLFNLKDELFFHGENPLRLRLTSKPKSSQCYL